MLEKKLLKSTVGFLLLSIVVFLSVSQTFGADKDQTSTSAQQIKKEIPKQVFKPTLSPSSFTPDMPLSEAINILRNCTDPPLNISVLWNDLEENAGIERDTPIGIDGLTGVSIKTHLNVLLMSLSAGGLAEITFVVDDGVIIIGTKDSLANKMKTIIYDISDLVAPSSGMNMGYGGMGYGGMGYGGMGTGYGSSRYGASGSYQFGNMGYNTGYNNYGYNTGYQGYNTNYNQGYNYGNQYNYSRGNGIVFGF